MSILHPVGELILVIPDETGEKTGGGIIIPDASKAVPETGRVLAVGDRAKGVKIGDLVLYDIEAGVDVESNGVKCLIMPTKYVYAVLN